MQLEQIREFHSLTQLSKLWIEKDFKVYFTE